MARTHVLKAGVSVRRGECALARKNMQRALALRPEDLELQRIALQMEIECVPREDAVEEREETP